MKKLFLIIVSLFIASTTFAQSVSYHGLARKIRNSATLPATCGIGDAYMDTDATSGQRFYLCESANTWALQGDGGAGGGDSITVNTTAATNANFLDNLYLDWAIDTAATPDDVTGKFNYAETLAGNPALLVDECVLFKDASGGGFICEGSTADTSEQLYRFPDVNGVDTTSYFMVDDTSITSIDDASLDVASAVLRRAALTGDVTASAGSNTTTIAADSVALTTDTTGNYAAGDAEAGAALTGDSATSFFSTGQIEAARGGTGDDTSATTGVPRISAGDWLYTAGLSHLASSTSADLAGILSDETGTGVSVFGTSPTITTSITQDGDSADAGYLRLNNAALIAWEASPAGTDVTLGVDASEEMLLDNAVGFGLDDQTDLRFYETDANGSNFLAFEAPSAITTTSTCTFEDDGNPIPDSCVGNGSDAGPKYLLFSSNSTNRTATFWQEPGGAGGTTESTVDEYISPETCTASLMYVAVETAPGAGNSWTVCANVNGTVLTEPCCAISGTATSCNETVNTGSLTGGQTFNWESLASGTPTGTASQNFVMVCTP